MLRVILASAAVIGLFPVALALLTVMLTVNHSYAKNYDGLAAEIERIGEECGFKFETLDRQATICYYTNLPSSLIQDSERKKYIRTRLAIVDKYESGSISYPQAIQELKSDIAADTGVDAAWMDAKYKKWMIAALRVDKEIIPNIKASMLFHESENRCNAAVKNLEAVFGETLRDNAFSFFCKPNPFYHPN